MAKQTIKPEIPAKPRTVVPAAEAQQRIIDATLELIRTMPFKEVTTEKIVEATGLAAPTIYRNFGSMNGLFSHLAEVLMQRPIERVEELASPDVREVVQNRMIDSDFILRAQLVAWLIGEGVDPESFYLDARSEVTHIFKSNLGLKDHRFASAWLNLTVVLAEGFATFGPSHKFTEQEVSDTLNLFNELRRHLPQIESQIKLD